MKKMILLIFLVAATCKNPANLAVDYYGQVIAFCGQESELPEETCRRQLRETIPYGESFSGNDREKERLENALYFLLHQPLLMPQETISDEFKALRERFPTYSWQQIIFNYVVNAADSFVVKESGKEPTFGNPIGGYYDGNINIVKLSSVLPLDWHQALTDAHTILHEATHAEAGDHNIICKNSANFDIIPECDLGLNLPFGRELTYSIALARAEVSLALPSNDKLKLIQSELCNDWQHIYGISAEQKKKGDDFCVNFSGKVISALEQIDSQFN